VPESISKSDEAFISRFERCELPEAEWTHLAHIRVAWVCLSILPADAALQRIRKGILRYNTEVLQRRHKYHETVTVAFTRIVADRMRAGESWEDFAQQIDDLLNTEMPVLLRYYSKNRLFSNTARDVFLEPDLEKFPAFSQDLQRLSNG